MCTHEDEGDVREALVCLADVLKARVVEENLLDNECGDCAGELAARLHDAQAQRDELGGQQEAHHVRLVRLRVGEVRGECVCACACVCVCECLHTP